MWGSDSPSFPPATVPSPAGASLGARLTGPSCWAQANKCLWGSASAAACPGQVLQRLNQRKSPGNDQKTFHLPMRELSPREWEHGPEIVQQDKDRVGSEMCSPESLLQTCWDEAPTHLWREATGRGFEFYSSMSTTL